MVAIRPTGSDNSVELEPVCFEIEVYHKGTIMVDCVLGSDEYQILALRHVLLAFWDSHGVLATSPDGDWIILSADDVAGLREAVRERVRVELVRAGEESGGRGLMGLSME